MQRDDNKKTLTLDNSLLLPQVVALINEGHSVTLPLKGYSMRPFLENDRDKAVLGKIEKLNIGDPVLAETAPGHYVLHRLIDIDGGKATLLGDGNISTETCHITDIKAIATAFYRKGRNTPDTIYQWKWKLYSAIWTRLRPIRRYLLFALHPHIPQKWRRKNITSTNQTNITTTN